MEYKRHPDRHFNHLLSAFIIYPLIIPFVVLDFFLEIYHHIAFRLYGLPLVERANYIRIDRHRLPYLGPIAKINCAYCGYVNGLLAYAGKIAADTEVYWCGIKHQVGNGYVEPAHHRDFLNYGDEVAYRNLNRERACKLSRENNLF